MPHTSPLEELGYPLFFAIDDVAGLDAPAPALDHAQRTRVRHLSGMQKEALVTDSRSGTTWRLASDEGDYLDGDDVAPCPLAFVTTGMVCSYANEVIALAEERGLGVRDLEIVQDNYYTMTGSALRGDMTGGALDPEIEVWIDADAEEADLRAVVRDAVAAAPVGGFLRGQLDNRFALALGGQRIDTDRVAELAAPLLDSAAHRFEEVPRDAAGQDPPLGRNTGRLTEEFTGDREQYTGGASSSLASEQDRVLHLRGTCTLREDGLKSVEVELFSPRGSVFELRSDEPAGHGGRGRAPDAMTYVAAGIGFCFMTQFGRYAGIVGTELTDYRIVQDTNVAGGGVSEPARAEPVETHVFLESPAGEDFAREVLDMSEQTCFLHALCRTALEPVVEVTPV